MKAILVWASLALLLCGCSQLTLSWAELDGDGEAASPPLFENASPDRETWEASRSALREKFEAAVYGYFPDDEATRVLSHRTVDTAAFGGAAILEEYEIQAVAEFQGVKRETEPFYVDVLLPAQSQGPVPVIIMQTFCPRWDTITHPNIYRPDGAGSCLEGPLTSVFGYVFGRYIARPPVEMILQRGYGLAAVFPSEAAPDARERGLKALAELAAGHKDRETRWGAVAAWAWLYSRVVDVLEDDPRVDRNGLITWGHSRYGKSALVAAAFDERIDGVIAHQSGTGGASLNKGKVGESVKSITATYPHWFARAYARYAGREKEMPVDQHQLIALIAPRPVLLGNARRDVWSDPTGAFRAARGADPAYELYGVSGLDQERLTPYKPEASLAFWIRPGTHGVVKEDWPAFLQFLDAHFNARPGAHGVVE